VLHCQTALLSGRTKWGISKIYITTQLSPDTFDPRKMNSNFLDANFGYFRLSTARDDENKENSTSYFLVFGLKSC